MTTQFGWFDTLHALSSYLACTAASSSTDSLHNYAHGAREPRPTASGSRAPHAQTNAHFPSDGLRPLLLEESTDDEYADTLSLHSNVGSTSGTRREEAGRDQPAVSARKSKRRGKKVRRNGGWFTVFGYDLFGRREGAIQLPLTDDEDEGEEDAGRSDGRMSRTRSGSTLDSDAAPLDDAAIAALSQAHILDQQDAAEEDVAELRERVKHAEKEERRRKRKERKALERALAAGLSHDDGEFQGFQGSGAGPLVPGLKNPSRSASTGASDEDEALADLGGSMYARTTVSVPGAGGNSSDSRTTTSNNIRSSSHTHKTASLQTSTSQNSVNDQTQKTKPRPHLTKPPPSVAASDSTRSASLPSPTGSVSLGPGLSLSLAPAQSGPQTRASQQPNPTRKDVNGNIKKSFDKGFTTPPFYGRENPNHGFPSVGFGRVGGGKGLSSNGAFLARRGDE